MDGRQYCLPTEKEWEYACRAGSKTEWGMRANGECGPLDVMGWYGQKNGCKTHPVAFKEPNAWGLFDMHGNVSEWCQDKSRGSNTSHRIRGGNWCENDWHCSAFNGNDAYYDNNHIGFRIVVTTSY
jgi:formylglycine-generating enzyme required for sulfatase activity